MKNWWVKMKKKLWIGNYLVQVEIKEVAVRNNKTTTKAFARIVDKVENRGVIKVKRHNCKHCGTKLTCKSKESMQELIDRHKEICRALKGKEVN